MHAQLEAAGQEAQENLGPFLRYPCLRRIIQTFANASPDEAVSSGSPMAGPDSHTPWGLSSTGSPPPIGTSASVPGEQPRWGSGAPSGGGGAPGLGPLGAARPQPGEALRAWACNPLVLGMLRRAAELLEEGRVRERELEHTILQQLRVRGMKGGSRHVPTTAITD